MENKECLVRKGLLIDKQDCANCIEGMPECIHLFPEEDPNEKDLWDTPGYAEDYISTNPSCVYDSVTTSEPCLDDIPF